ncbi:outer membrane protein assembly factor BamD [Pseudoxanthomonas suwonensis]|uniref:Outer membrane protein assembly factor BamD n=1 Tax=Pseudoxanthomonas suwonensis TaxID=314722 RepID=A0A0E3Z0H3_9GAMM|nr:outer membrane protein assembly factor BamD [Pseudoxanthomonas suwonensis]AKC86112.1 competence protein [Pseudoxanthomonas suwonensis]
MAHRPRFALPAPLRLAALLLAAAFLATGCGRNSKEDADEGLPVTELYDKAHKRMQAGNWSEAERVFKRLVAQYPYGPYTEQALMETAYAQFKAGKHEDAVSTIDRFIRTYPTHRNIAYFYYLRGLANSNRDAVFLQRVWSLDPSRRDLASPQQAYDDFSRVVQRYPNSRYVDDARQRMVELRNMFARHEMDTALYYMRRGAWLSAVSRAQYILETYPQSEFQNDAIAALAESYRQLDNQTLSADAIRVLRLNDPQHPYLHGDWPDYPWAVRKLNPFAGEKSPTGQRNATRDR